MGIRVLTSFEQNVSASIVALANVRQWEFAAFLDGSSGTLIEIRTRMDPQGADPSSDVIDLARSGKPIVVHHNHLSQESLSEADWNGLVDLFDETFAHCADGTMYWGRVLRDDAVRAMFSNGSPETMGMNFLFNLIQSYPESSVIALFFRKEVVNRAMRLRGFVEYEYMWGSGVAIPMNPQQLHLQPAGQWGKSFDQYIDQAAGSLAPNL